MINAGDGWLDQYLAGYVWNHPTVTFAKMLGLKNASVSGAFLGNFLVGVLLPALLMLTVVYFIWVRKNFIRDMAKAGTGVKGFREPY